MWAKIFMIINFIFKSGEYAFIGIWVFIRMNTFHKMLQMLWNRLHPLFGGGDLLFLLSPLAAAAFCFCSHSKTPARIISKYLQYAFWPLGICLVIFFLSFFFLQQNRRWLPKSYVAL